MTERELRSTIRVDYKKMDAGRRSSDEKTAVELDDQPLKEKSIFVTRETVSDEDTDELTEASEISEDEQLKTLLKTERRLKRAKQIREAEIRIERLKMDVASKDVKMAASKRTSSTGADSRSSIRLLKTIIDQSRSSESEDDGALSCSTDKGKQKKALKSGLYRKSSDKNFVPQEWPHLHLNMNYAMKDVSFYDLSVQTFVAGEVDIIVKTSDDIEMKGRLGLLNVLMYYADMVEFENILRWYAEWVRSIERGENTWADDPTKTGEIILGRANFRSNPNKVGKGHDKPDGWFCSAYQRNSCNKSAPHKGLIKGVQRDVEHFCARCYIKSHEKLRHPESSAECPNKSLDSE